MRAKQPLATGRPRAKARSGRPVRGTVGSGVPVTLNSSAAPTKAEFKKMLRPRGSK